MPVASFCASETAETGRIANGREQGDHVSRRQENFKVFCPTFCTLQKVGQRSRRRAAIGCRRQHKKAAQPPIIARSAKICCDSNRKCRRGRRKSREAATRPIQGTVWHLVEFDGKPVDAPDKYELSFLADGRVAGIGECNRFFGPYQVVNANGGIKIGPVASTMMACLDPNIETEFFRMFENVHLYQLDEKNLYLFVDNKIKAVFETTDKPVDEE